MLSWINRLPAAYRLGYPAPGWLRVGAGFVLFLLLLCFDILLREWLVIGVLASPDVVASYHFGSDAMVGEGGPKYASAAIYARTALHQALFPVLPLVVAFWLATVRSKRFYHALAWPLLLVVALGCWLGR